MRKLLTSHIIVKISDFEDETDTDDELDAAQGDVQSQPGTSGGNSSWDAVRAGAGGDHVGDRRSQGGVAQSGSEVIVFIANITIDDYHYDYNHYIVMPSYYCSSNKIGVIITTLHRPLVICFCCIFCMYYHAMYSVIQQNMLNMCK